MEEGAWTAWTWAALAFNFLFSTLFAILCWFCWGEFTRVADDPKVKAQINKDDWESLFDGAASSAFFAVFLVCAFAGISIWYMVLSRKSLAHPRSKYGRGFLVAAAFFTALHICNISSQFYSFRGAMSTWRVTFEVHFNNSLLAACYSLGFISTLAFLVLTVMLILWRDKTAESAERQILASASNLN